MCVSPKVLPLEGGAIKPSKCDSPAGGAGSAFDGEAFAAADTDGDGMISIEEAFAAADTDGDGVISASEYAAAFSHRVLTPFWTATLYARRVPFGVDWTVGFPLGLLDRFLFGPSPYMRGGVAAGTRRSWRGGPRPTRRWAVRSRRGRCCCRRARRATG